MGRAAALLAAGMFLSFGTMLASAGLLLLSVVIAPAYFGVGFAARRLGVSAWATLVCGAALPLLVQTSAMAFRFGGVSLRPVFGFAGAAGLLYWGWRRGSSQKGLKTQ
jgi:hypothetical protein